VSTPSERLEATIWLEANLPNAEPDVVEEFLAAVDEHYAEHPTASRGNHPLTTLREDQQAFARILSAILPKDHPSATAIRSI
jgi:hypothetical protein